MNTIVVHSTDAGRTWREVARTRQVTDPDGQLAFSFLDVARGWIVSRNGRSEPDEAEMVGTRDGGQRWQSLPEPRYPL